MLSNICDDLKTRYDTNILNLNDNIRKIFQDISINNIKNSIKTANTTLMQLIINNSRNNKPIASRISGPKTLTLHYSHKYKKTVYIFGEFHGWEGTCPGASCPIGETRGDDHICRKGQINEEKKEDGTVFITDYLNELFLNTNVFIDFFLEIRPPDSKHGYSSDYLIREYAQTQSIFKIFENSIDCINSATRETFEKCRLVRSHYIDVRVKEKNVHDSNSIIVFWNQFAHGTKDKNYYELVRPNKNHKFNFLPLLSKLQLPVKDLVKFFIKQLYTKIVRKEVERSYLSREIYTWFLDNINSQVKIIQRTLRQYSKLIIEKGINLSFDYLKYCVRIIMASLMDIILLQTDVYALSRIFKKFNVVDNKQPDEAYNIIIYGGNIHSENYRKFLNENGFELVASENIDGINQGFNAGYKYPNLRCLDMNKIPQPFFQYY